MEQDDAKYDDDDWGTPHAFHLNLPPHHLDEDGIPFITKFAHKKARMVVDLALSIQLTESMFVEEDGNDISNSIHQGGAKPMEVDTEEDDDENSETLVSDGTSRTLLQFVSSQ